MAQQQNSHTTARNDATTHTVKVTNNVLTSLPFHFYIHNLQSDPSAGPSIQVHPADNSRNGASAAANNQAGFAPQDKAAPAPAATSQTHAAAAQSSTQSRDMNKSTNGNNLNVPAAGASKGVGANETYQREAERIVAEEREASEKMPYYEGLSERFQLIKKMGDGAFSNVYKARDRQTGQKVAIKVVRKYELNSNQVRILDKSCSGFGFGCVLFRILVSRRALLPFSFSFRCLVSFLFAFRFWSDDFSRKIQAPT